VHPPRILIYLDLFLAETDDYELFCSKRYSGKTYVPLLQKTVTFRWLYATCQRVYPLAILAAADPFAKIANLSHPFSRRLIMDDRRLLGNLGKNPPLSPILPTEFIAVIIFLPPPSPPPFF
jgi:hypothetical protein